MGTKLTLREWGHIDGGNEDVSDCKILPVSSAYIDLYWDAAAPFIQMALDEDRSGDVDLADIYERLLDMRMQLAVVQLHDKLIAALVTDIVVTPHNRVLRLLLCGGSRLDLWRNKMIDLMVLGARNIRANHIEIVGRLGWIRKFKDIDNQFEPKVVLRAEV